MTKDEENVEQYKEPTRNLPNICVNLNATDGLAIFI